MFKEHCASCHGVNRRGATDRAVKMLIRPADLRDPALLASRSDAQLTEVIMRGIEGPPKTRPAVENGARPDKEMPGFQSELGEQDALDIVAFLRGDSIYLEECFAGATHYAQLKQSSLGPPLYAAYSAAQAGLRPTVVAADAKPPDGARRLGFVMFVEVELPGAGSTPIALLAEDDGRFSGVRVALPEPDNGKAERDIFAVFTQGMESAPLLRPAEGTLKEAKQRFDAAVREAH
jgi:hypothetical protein